jgi:hypothetical protein
MTRIKQFPTYAVVNKETQWQLVDDKPVKISTVIVHEFSIGDVEDPDIYAADPLLEWQHSEAGMWVMEHSIELPQWHRRVDQYTYGYRYCIAARLTEQNELFFKLKFQ